MKGAEGSATESGLGRRGPGRGTRGPGSHSTLDRLCLGLNSWASLVACAPSLTCTHVYKLTPATCRVLGDGPEQMDGPTALPPPASLPLPQPCHQP